MPVAARSVGRRESLASWAVVGAVVLVLAGLIVRQGWFNQAVTEALKVEGVGGKAAAGVVPELPAGLAVMSPPESFNRETLSDKINGRAELYLPAGFVGLRSQRVKFADDSGEWFEIYVYDMGGPRNAFSVYSTQRRAGAPDVDFATHGYLTSNALAFVNGGNYIEIIASGTGENVTRAMQALGRKLSTGAMAAAGGLGEADMFPKDGLVPGSIALISRNAFSFGAFDNIFMARYRDGGAEVTVFLSTRKSPAEASQLATAYRKFLIELDGRDLAAGKDGWLVDMDGEFEGAFAVGRILGGVHQASTAKAGEKWLARMRRAAEERAK